MPLKPPPTQSSLRLGSAGEPAADLPGAAEPWLDALPLGLAWLDAQGRVLHANPRFHELAGAPFDTLSLAPPDIQALLAWGQGGAWPPMKSAAVRADNAPLLERNARLSADPARGQPSRSLRARLHAARRGNRPADRITSGAVYVCTLEDLHIEDECDLAQTQLAAVVEMAGVGLASYELTPEGLVATGSAVAASPAPAVQETGSPAADAPAGLRSIGKEAIQPESLQAFQRVQAAIRHGEAAQERYAVSHPEMGTRWLSTRVQPLHTRHGLHAAAVLTQDVTEREHARERQAQMQRELDAVLECSPTGIAYLRGQVLARCNGRFERMLGLPEHSAAGRRWQDLLATVPQGPALMKDALAALRLATTFSTEVSAEQADGRPLHLLLDIKRLTPVDAAWDNAEAVVVLSNVTQQKTQQIEMAELGRERELMFDLSGVGIAFIRNGRVQRANTALARLLGYNDAGLVGMQWADLLAEQSGGEGLGRHALDDARDPPSVSSDQDWTRECLMRRADGSRVWFEVTQRRVAPGQPSAGVILSCVNVDDRHRAERVVAEQAERTRTILDSVLVGIVTVGENGIEWMNRSARRMFGGDLADFFGQPVSTVATDEIDHPFRRTEHLSELAEGQAHTFECQVKARDGRLFWVVGNAVATFSSRGRRQITYALLDIERRREAEAKTAEAQASLQRVIEMAPLAITLRDARTLQVLQMNQVATALHGHAIGKTPEEIYDADTAAQMRADMEAALAASLPTSREYRLERDGQTQVWDARYLPLAKPGLPPDQLLLVATDVTEQRAAAQAQLEAAIAQREMLVREVHHRIKNNLQGVAGLLQQIAGNKPEVAAAISEVVGQVQAIAQVYGLQVGTAGPLKVRRVVEAIAQSVQRTYKRSIALRVEGDAAHEWVLPEAESIPIALCLNELLTNAVKHASSDDIVCRLVCDQDVHIEVRNPGALPAGFTLDRVPGGVSGLGLVRALLPRRSAKLQLEQQGDLVVAGLHLTPPGVSRLTPGIPTEPPGQQITLWPQ